MSSTDTRSHQLAPAHRESHYVPPAPVGNAISLHPFAVDMSAHMPSGSVSPPASSCSTGTALGAPSCGSGTPAQPSNKGHQHGQQATCHHRQQQGVGAMMAGHAAGGQGYPGAKEWLYKLVTFPSYFTPCLSCCSGNRTPKREQLMTLFDTKYPHKVFCSHCPECQVSGGASLLQVRRASFKDVVKATDICRFGADVSGVQQYTLNGSKVIYLNREQATADKKNSNAGAAPAMCTVDGRAMMDKASLYCSLKCKMQAEDAGFTCWLDQQDPSVRILADIAANAPPRPTVACKRAAQPTSSGSSGSGLTDSGSGGSSGARPKKAARTASSGGTIGAAAGAPAAQGTGGESAAPKAAAGTAAAGAGRSRQRPAAPIQRAASAFAAGNGMSGAPAGLKPIRTSLHSNNGSSKPAAAGVASKPAAVPVARQASAPSAFMGAAMSEPQLGHSFSTSTATAIGTSATGNNQQQPQLAAPADISGSSWLAAPAELDNALSSSGNIGSWESWGSWEAGGVNSPAFGLGVHDTWEEDGSLSPALITTAPAGGLGGPCITAMGSTMEDWWLPTSPTGAFPAAGLAGF